MGSKLSPLNVKQLKGESEDIEVNAPKQCEHFFSYRTAREILCRKCNIGLFLQGDEKCENGHLYSGGKLVL